MKSREGVSYTRDKEGTLKNQEGAHFPLITYKKWINIKVNQANWNCFSMHWFMPSVSLGRGPSQREERFLILVSISINVLDKRHLLKHLDCTKLRSSQVAPLVKNPAANAGGISAMGLIPGLGRSLGGGHGNPLQCSCLENPMAEELGGLQFIGSQRV